MQGVWVWSLLGVLRSHMPYGQEIKTENRSNIVINSIKTFKIVHVQKNLKRKYFYYEDNRLFRISV